MVLFLNRQINSLSGPPCHYGAWGFSEVLSSVAPLVTAARVKGYFAKDLIFGNSRDPAPPLHNAAGRKSNV